MRGVNGNATGKTVHPSTSSSASQRTAPRTLTYLHLTIAVKLSAKLIPVTEDRRDGLNEKKGCGFREQRRVTRTPSTTLTTTTTTSSNAMTMHHSSYRKGTEFGERWKCDTKSTEHERFEGGKRCRSRGCHALVSIGPITADNHYDITLPGRLNQTNPRVHVT